MKQPHLSPFRDPLRVLLYHANQNELGTVVINDWALMAGREESGIDEEETVARADEIVSKLQV